MLLVNRQQKQKQHQNQREQPHPKAATATVVCPRSVVTFYHGSGNASLPRIREEVDLSDLEALVETYKFLATQQKKNASSCRTRLQNKRRVRPSHTNSNSSNSQTVVVSELHKQAIMTLVKVDRTTKRVVGIRPEFFPKNSRGLPPCLTRLESLRTLRLDHCQQLASVPAGFCLEALQELHIDVSSFEDAFPASFGNLRSLRRLILKGECPGLHGETLLVPESMAKLTELRYLETHSQNLLHIPADVIESWSSVLEVLVVTHDLTSSSSSKSGGIATTASRKKIGGVLQHGYSSESSFSSDDDFNFLDYSGDEISDDDESDDAGFSLLKHGAVFREALRNQLESRAFSSIARFTNLRSLKLVFDDSKYRSNIHTARSRFRNKRKNKTSHHEDPYKVPLEVLANGPLSLSLKELDIGTYIASTTSSASNKKSKIPIEVSWMDVLQQFPRLERLRLQDCRCTVLDPSTGIDEEDDDTLFFLPRLKYLVLDRCPEFALVQGTASIPPCENEEDSGIFPPLQDDDDNIIFCPLTGGGAEDHETKTSLHNTNNTDDDDLSLEPIDKDAIDALVDDDEDDEIARIIRLTGLLADTILKDTTDDDDDESFLAGKRHPDKLSILCRHLLIRCPRLELLSLRDCGIVGFCNDLLTCLPKDHLLELTLDAAHDQDVDHVHEAVRNNLWALLDVYPSLMQIRGTYSDGLGRSGAEKLHRTLHQRQQQQQHRTRENRQKQKQPQRQQSESSQQHQKHPPPWKMFFDKQRPSTTNKENNNPVAAVVNILERKLFHGRDSEHKVNKNDHDDDDNHDCDDDETLLRTITRSNSRGML